MCRRLTAEFQRCNQKQDLPSPSTGKQTNKLVRMKSSLFVYQYLCRVVGQRKRDSEARDALRFAVMILLAFCLLQRRGGIFLEHRLAIITFLVRIFVLVPYTAGCDTTRTPVSLRRSFALAMILTASFYSPFRARKPSVSEMQQDCSQHMIKRTLGK